MTPFETFFATEWPRRLASLPDDRGALTGGSIRDASWDRKAAYLVWTASPVAKPTVQDLFS